MAKLSTKSMQIEDENGLKAYQCPACPRTFKKPYALGTHMSHAHREEYERMTGKKVKPHKPYTYKKHEQTPEEHEANEPVMMPDIQYCPSCGLNLHFVRAGLSLAYKQKKG